MNTQNEKTATYDVTNFTIREMTECGRVMRTIGEGASSMEEVADRIAGRFYTGLSDATGKRACSLVRFYKTHAYVDLDKELQGFAQTMLGDHPPSPDMKCLVLLATAGEEPAWNSRKTSQGHKAIPIPNEEAISHLPMVSNLIMQLGLTLGMVINPDPKLLGDLSQKNFNIFYVPDALNSPFIPAQNEFVIPHGIKSALGFGGLLPGGALFAVIIFFKVRISKEAADLFRTLCLNVKIAVLPFEKAIFS